MIEVKSIIKDIGEYYSGDDYPITSHEYNFYQYYGRKNHIICSDKEYPTFIIALIDSNLYFIGYEI